MTRRNVFRPIIAQIIAANRGEPLSVVRAKLREAFPCGMRRYHPYRIWLDEIRMQLGLRKLRKNERRRHAPAINQASLFGDANHH